MNEPENNPGPPAEKPAPAASPPPAAAHPPAPSQPAENRPAESRPAESQPAENQPAENPPAAATGSSAAPAAPAPSGTAPRKRRRRRRARTDKGPDETAAPAASGGPPQEHRRGRGPAPRRDRSGGVGGSRDSAHYATQAVRALAAMAQQLLRVEGIDPLAMPRYLELALRVPLDGGKDVRQAAGVAVEQILKRVREVREHERALRPGAVFSYFHGSSEAMGCRPTEARQVFDGYSSTGKPTFADFVTLAIERKDDGIDRLLAGDDVILTHVTMGRVLRTQQLAEFGGNSPIYKILGQVNAGLFKVLSAAGKCAFSFQLLRGTTLEGHVRLRLHPVSAVDPMDLADPAIMQILSRFQRRLDAEALRLEGRIQNGDTDEEEFVLPLLNELAKQLQNRTRSVGRRTQHGLERAEAGQRPTSRAYPDAGEASDDAILWDLDQGTIVVVGPRNRVHVFSPDGRHVTSVAMQRSAIDRRRQLGRWRQAEPEERGEFRIQVRRSLAEEPQAEPAPTPPKAKSAPPPAPTSEPESPAGASSEAPSPAPEALSTSEPAPAPGAPAAPEAAPAPEPSPAPETSPAPPNPPGPGDERS